MNTTIIRFLKKFLVAMYSRDVREFPCAGLAYDNAVTALENKLAEMIPEEEFDNISDIFILVPVSETHTAFLNWLIATCCVVLSFSYSSNKATIKDMNAYQIKKIKEEETRGLSLTDEHYKILAETFCLAANI